jgi:voltage-gated potassium channel
VTSLRRIGRALLAFWLVIVAGTVGYVILGFGFVDALYQTVTTITTVGFREVHPLSTVGELFTIVLILVGVGTALYMFGVLLEALIEGHLRQQLGRRRMERQIGRMTGHFIICGWGRVGRAAVLYLEALGMQVVVVDQDPARLQGLDYPTVLGDVTDDSILQAAGIGHAHALIAALNTDADNVFVTLSSRALRPDLVIIARARTEDSRSKLLRAGANRAVNPQLIGGRRMAAFALQPHVAEFLDVVMHDETLDYRIEEMKITPASPLVGRCLADTALGLRTGALVLAIRTASGQFIANPAPDTQLEPDTILIALGTSAQLRSVRRPGDHPGSPNRVHGHGAPLSAPHHGDPSAQPTPSRRPPSASASPADRRPRPKPTGPPACSRRSRPSPH